MGVILLAQCKKCAYEERLFLGGGLKDCEMKTLIQAIPKKFYWKFKAVLARMRPGGFSIDRKAGICGKCGILCTAPVVDFENIDGTTRQIAGVCPQCGGKVDFLADEALLAGVACCPKCEGMLSARQDGHWD